MAWHRRPREPRARRGRARGARDKGGADREVRREEAAAPPRAAGCSLPLTAGRPCCGTPDEQVSRQKFTNHGVHEHSCPRTSNQRPQAWLHPGA